MSNGFQFSRDGIRSARDRVSAGVAVLLDFTEVIEKRLWVGAFVRPDDVPRLQQIGITSVLSIQTDEDLLNCGVSVKKLCRAYDAAGINFLRRPVDDFDRNLLARELPSCVQLLEVALAQSPARVYVHCTAGVNRSPTVVAAYLIRRDRISAREAYDLVTGRRHCSPYLRLLEDYECSLKTEF